MEPNSVDGGAWGVVRCPGGGPKAPGEDAGKHPRQKRESLAGRTASCLDCQQVYKLQRHDVSA